MKMKVTNKQIREGYNNIISVGYCSAYYLLYGKEPMFYSAGVYGWNQDTYHINNNIAISTGYRPVGNINPPYELTREYNEKARKIYNNNKLKYETIKERINKLLDEYIEKCFEL